MLRKFVTVMLPFIAVITTGAAQLWAQGSRDLNGFRLGQYRSVTHRDLGRPDRQGDTDEQIEYEAFLIREDPVLYMVFQYQKSDPHTIWSIQITGEDTKHDLGFRGLRFGMTPSEVEKVLGRPARKKNVGEHGTLWEYNKVNYSVEINSRGKLSSIRIVNDSDVEPDRKRYPKFADVVKTLQTGTNADLAELFAPDSEVHDGDAVRSFQSSMKNEVTNDVSGVFASVRRLSKELQMVDPAKPDQYEENTLLVPGRDPLHVMQLWKLKGVTEIAFQWNGEKWQIRKFGAKKQTPPPQDWKSIYTPGSLKEIVSKRIPDLIKTPNVALAKDNGKPLASFSFNSYPTSTKVRYTGETRKTPESTISLISLWLTTIGKPKEVAKRFEFELKVIENGTEYWLPIQHPIPERLTREVKKDDDITIYLAWIGIKYEGDRPELLAIVNEFTPPSK